MKETLKTDVGEENRRRGGGVFNLILCIALVVTCSIYLHNLNQTIQLSSSYEFECIPAILPPELRDDCRHVGQWKSYAILGIIRGSFYILQIVGHFICWYMWKPGSGKPDPKSGPQCGFLITLTTMAISLAISIIPIYMAVNLVRTSAIYSTTPSLANPAKAAFVFCMIEIIGLLLQLLCVVCVAVGLTTTTGCVLCCVYCRKDDGTRKIGQKNNEPKGEEMKPMKLESVMVSK